MRNKVTALILIISVFIVLIGAQVFSQCPPEVLYYKFKNNINYTTPNFGIPGYGSQMANVVGQYIRSGGEIDSCLVGNGGTNNYINTGWTTNIGTGNWTISFWLSDIVDLNPTYLFGDATAGNFRCFYGGAAGTNSILLRGNFADVRVQNLTPGAMVIHFVYNGSAIKVYENGTLFAVYARSGINLTGSAPFQVGGFAQHNCLNAGGKMDEFRFYNRALNDAEISSTWNIELSCLTGINKNSNVPDKYKLNQNYPNPFNPATEITYDLAGPGNVKLTVYDMSGKEISTLVNDHQPVGNYKVEFNASNYSSGVYFYKLETEKFSETKKMILVK